VLRAQPQVQTSNKQVQTMTTSSFSRKLFPVFVVLCIAAFAAARDGDFDDELYTYGVTETNQFVTKSFESGSFESASGMSNFAS